MQTGIDLLVLGGPDLDRVVQAVAEVTGLPPEAIKSPPDAEGKRLAVLDFPFWAVIHAYAAGDICFKVDLDGKAPRDCYGIARALAVVLNVGVAWPDERTLAPMAAVLCQPSGAERSCTIDDLRDGRDGLVLTICSAA